MPRHSLCSVTNALGLISSILILPSVALSVILCLRAPSSALFDQQKVQCDLYNNQGASRYNILAESVWLKAFLTLRFCRSEQRAGMPVAMVL